MSKSESTAVALAATRARIKNARKLTDMQVDRLQGDTPEALEADAVAMFGPAPEMTPAEIRKRAKDLWPQ